MTKNRKGEKVALGVGIAGIVATAIFLFLRKKEPPPPPEPGLATLWGIVTDAQTGETVDDIEVVCNGYSAVTDISGRYEMQNIEPGTYTITFTDPFGRYEPITI